MPSKALIAMLVLTTGGLFTTTILFAALWVSARERAIRAMIDKRRETEVRGVDLEHLVNAVDAIAVEVERISEAQRFTARVLVDRDENSAALKRFPERNITPH